MKIYHVSSGQVSSGIVLSGGDAEYVLSGGSAVSTVVKTGGTEVVFSGGTVISTLIEGGTEVLSDGAIAAGTRIGGGGIQEVLSGAIASAASVGSGGDQYVVSALARGTIIGNGGYEVVDAGGAARGTDVQSGGTLIVLPGGLAVNTDVESGGRLLSGGVVVLSGFGVVSAAEHILSGGVMSGPLVEYVLNGGSALGGILTGATEEVYAGGTASGAVIRGGEQLVLSGGFAEGTLVSAGSILVQAAGVVASAVLLASGTMFIDASGFARQTVVSAGGSAFVFSGGAALQTTVSAGGFQFIQADGVARDTIVASGGIEFVGIFGSSEVTDVQSGGEEYVSNGSADGTIVEAGGVMVVGTGQQVTGTDVQSGGMVVVLPSGSASGTVTEHGGLVLSNGVFLLSGLRLIAATGSGLVSATVGTGETEYVLGGGIARFGTVTGTQNIYGGGVAIGVHLGSSGTQMVQSGGLASNTAIGNGGTLDVAFGAQAIGVAVNSGGEALVLDGSATSTTIASGGVQFIEAGIENATTILAGGLDVLRGTGSGTVIESGGEQLVAFGLASGTTVSSGGFMLLSTGGMAVQTQVESGGLVILLPGATASQTAVQQGGEVQSTGVVILSGFEVAMNAAGELSNAVVSIAETEYVLQAGTAVGNTVFGVQDVASGGIARGNTVFGTDFVLSGGIVRNTFLSGGQLFLAGGAVASGTVIGIGASATVSSGAVASGSFISGFGTETILAGGTASGSIIGPQGIEVVQSGGREINAELMQGGTLELEAFGFISGGEADYNHKLDLLTISAGGKVEYLHLTGDYTDEFFHVEGGFGADITVDNTPCYCRGTRILTQAGDVAIEDLRIGDRIVTHAGAVRVLRWIGRRAYDRRFIAGNRAVLPVTFRAGSLGDGLPRRDLRVSPLHAMYIDGMLIPAACLVNHATIVQPDVSEDVAYFHLELDSHEIIVAEGAPSESYVDDANRNMFHNAADYRPTNRAAATPARYCAPRIDHGDALEAVRRRLGSHSPSVPRGLLRGWLDAVDHGCITGWAQDDCGPVRLRFLANGATLGEAVADIMRPDVAAGTPCGFAFVIPGGLQPDLPHVIDVLRASDDAPLPQSPWRLQPFVLHDDGGLPLLQGNVDRADRDLILGWACAGPAPVAVQILDNGACVGRVLANRYRADVAEAGIGEGRHAFEFAFPGGLSPAIRHVIEVRRERDGAKLPNGSVTIQPAGSFDAALERALAAAVDASDAASREHVLHVLLREAARLRQQHADAQGGRRIRAAAREAELAGDIPLAAPRRALLISAADGITPGDTVALLQAQGYEVSLATPDSPETLTGVSGVILCGAPFYASVEEVLQRQAGCFDLVCLQTESLEQLYVPLIRYWMPRTRIVVAALKPNDDAVSVSHQRS